MGNIVYIGGCWSPNIGNSFIDYGAMYTCKKHHVYIYSEWNRAMFGGNRDKFFRTFSDLKPQCIVFSGMVTCNQFTIDQKEDIQDIDKIGIPIVLNGVGGENYNNSEVATFRAFIKQHNFCGFISRDNRSYDAYGDLFKKSYRGIDVGFFISDIDKFRLLKDLPKKYTVINEDDLGFNKNVVDMEEYKQAVNDGSIVYCHHQTTHIKPQYLSKPRTMISELPDEYICLYAQSKMTFATRVHACVATLSFGGKCFQPYNTPRSAIFEAVGCQNIVSRPVSVDPIILKEKKRQHQIALDSILDEIIK